MALVRVAQKGSGSGESLSRESLLNELIVLRVNEVDDNFATKRGPTSIAKCSVLAVSGEHAGKVDDSFYAFGLLRTRVLEDIGVGNAAAIRIVAGPEKDNGRRAWWSFDSVSDEESEKAAALAEKLGFSV